MRRRQPPPQTEADYPPCCGPHAWQRAMEITLAEVDEMPALMAQACEHVLAEIDRRQRYWEDMRPADADPRWYQPTPVRQALTAEYRRRGIAR